MRRLLLPSLLIVMTLVVVAKTGISFLERESVIQSIATDQAVQPESINASSVDVAATTVLALGDHLIPSAEAAASIAIAEESFSTSAEREFLASLRATREKLTEKEKSLGEREKEAEAAEQRAAERIAELESLEMRIQDLLQQEESIKSKKIKRLTAVYEGMKAEKAAPVIASMELLTVVKMFSRMNEKQVGKILSFLPPEKAVQISHALTKKISTIK